MARLTESSLKVGRLHVDQIDKSDDLNRTLEFSANVRMGYISKRLEDKSLTEASSAGASIGFHRALFIPDFHVNMVLYSAESLAGKQAQNAINGDLLGGRNYVGFIGEASLDYTHAGHHLRVGRLLLDTPRADSDDIRQIPDLFEGMQYNFENAQNWHIDAAYLTGMAGWENEAEVDRFVSVYDAFGISHSDGSAINGGFAMLHAGYEKGDFSVQAFDYQLIDAVNMFYLEISNAQQLSDVWSLSYAMQWGLDQATSSFSQDGGTTTTSKLNAQVAGAFVTLSQEKSGSTLTVATDIGIGSDAPLRSLGGGSYFTSLEDSVFDAVVSDGKGSAYVVALEQDGSALIDGLNMTYYWGIFETADKSSSKFFEQDLIIEYAKNGSYQCTLAYAHIKDASQVSGNGFDQLRLFVNFPFEK